MNYQEIFFHDEEVFRLQKERLLLHVVPSHNLPANPFLGNPSYIAFEEWDWALSGSFWPALCALAANVGDKSVLLAVLEPNSETYFKANFGYYNWAIIPTASSAEDYWRLINSGPLDSPADSVLANADKIVWLSESGRWAIWGQRDASMCVLGSALPIGVSGWKDIGWAAQMYTNKSLEEPSVKAAWVSRLLFSFKK